jgi:hypothetical protein
MALGEPDCPVDANQVSKWERGVRNPGPFYRPRLCLALDTMPQELGFEPEARQPSTGCLAGGAELLCVNNNDNDS